MIFKPVKLGQEALERDVLITDRKNCKRFGPCGVGEKALYLNGFYLSCRYYLPYAGITRAYKRVAMSKGGFSHKGIFASIPYMVVEYDGGREKQCTFKYEEQLDQLLACLEREHPEIKRVSAQGEERLAARWEEEAAQAKPELTEEAQQTLKVLKEAETILEKRPDLYLELSKSARQKRQLLLTVAQRRNGAVKKREQPILDRASQAQKDMEGYLPESFPLPTRYAHPVVLRRMARIVESGRAVALDEALEDVKADLKALNSGVAVSQEEHDEVVAIKAMFLNEDYR